MIHVFHQREAMFQGERSVGWLSLLAFVLSLFSWLFICGCAITSDNSGKALLVDPSSLTFGRVIVGGNSWQNVTISNTRGAILIITQANIRGTSFNVAGLTLPLTLSPGESSSFSVRFAPTVAGNLAGSVSLVSNASRSPAMIALTGNGIQPPSTPPVISGVAILNVTSSGALISWTTDKPSTSQVEWGASASYGNSSPLDSSMVTSHAVALGGLSANTLYHFRVKSQDAAGSQVVSNDSTFTTSAAPSLRPTQPIAGAPAPSATILWSADMETGDLTQWAADLDGLVDNARTGIATASTDYSHVGSYSAKLTLNGDWDNAEMHRWKESRDPTYFESGLYYGAWFYIPSQFYMTKGTSNGNFYNFMQFLSASWTPVNGCNNGAPRSAKQWMLPWQLMFQNRTPQSSSPLYIVLTWGSGTTPITGPYANSNRGIKLWTSPFHPELNFPIGRWFHIEVYLKQWPHDVTPYHGRIMVWQDGVLMFDMGGSSDPNGGITTKPGDDLDGSNLCHGTDEPSWNAYSDGVDSYPSSIYVDDVQISHGPVP